MIQSGSQGSDKWKKRPCVVRYRTWADDARVRATVVFPDAPVMIECHAYIAMPKSWSAKKQNQLYGQYHREKPDGDNILKAACDALFKDDKGIAEMRIVKRWCSRGEERLEVAVS